ncbi:DUF1127 domain-containing protein [Hoeflea olei]|uniref:DUF1127 domain-containing protein n=1 Tax=Hoeflea olei TaxID=1480615 RepID=UPI0009F6F238|nr:DUF1127 domain-containing protein [Hoeflea olei]
MTYENSVHRFDASLSAQLSREILSLWWRNWTTRRALARLTREELADVGLTQAQRAREIARPFWR